MRKSAYASVIHYISGEVFCMHYYNICWTMLNRPPYLWSMYVADFPFCETNRC